MTPNTVLLGEIGLGGELRPVTRTFARIREAEKLGFERCILPAGGHGVEAESDFRAVENRTAAGFNCERSLRNRLRVIVCAYNRSIYPFTLIPDAWL